MISLEEAKDLTWGTYGKSGKDPLKFVRLDECTTNHLKNIYINLREKHRNGDVTDKYMSGVQLILENRKVKLPEELFQI